MMSRKKIFYFDGLHPFEDDFYVPTSCILPQRSNEALAKGSKASELSISTMDHEEANLVCFMNFVNPNFAQKWPLKPGIFSPICFIFQHYWC